MKSLQITKVKTGIMQMCSENRKKPVADCKRLQSATGFIHRQYHNIHYASNVSIFKICCSISFSINSRYPHASKSISSIESYPKSPESGVS